jgi:RNA polymerase sigma-70 factor (ECF subfamily)
MAMSEGDQDRAFLDRWRGGDENAAREIFERYVDQLVTLARRRISERLASRIDPEDIVQSVFRTFFHRAREGQFQLADPDDLCKLLAKITIHKTLRVIAYHQRAKRNRGLETGQGEVSDELLMAVCAGEPSPEDAAAFVDQLTHLLDSLAPEDQQVLTLRMEGYGTAEIAEKLGISTRTVRRLMERIRGLAERDGLGPA